MSRPVPLLSDAAEALRAARAQLAVLEASIASFVGTAEAYDYPRGYTKEQVAAMQTRLGELEAWVERAPPHLHASHVHNEIDTLRHRIGILENYRSMSRHLATRANDLDVAAATELRVRIARLEAAAATAAAAAAV